MLLICSGEPLTVQAPGTQTRSFCYVSDMVYCSWFLVLIVVNIEEVFSKLHFKIWRLMVWCDWWKEIILVPSTLAIQVKLCCQKRMKMKPLDSTFYWQYYAFYVSGEFTMLELAETVKEVSVRSTFHVIQLMIYHILKFLELYCIPELIHYYINSWSILMWKSQWWRTPLMILAKESLTSQKQRRCLDGNPKLSCAMAFLSWRKISVPG